LIRKKPPSFMRSLPEHLSDWTSSSRNHILCSAQDDSFATFWPLSNNRDPGSSASSPQVYISLGGSCRARFCRHLETPPIAVFQGRIEDVLCKISLFDRSSLRINRHYFSRKKSPHFGSSKGATANFPFLGILHIFFDNLPKMETIDCKSYCQWKKSRTLKQWPQNKIPIMTSFSPYYS